MNIAINTSPLSGGHKTRGTGIYTAKLIEALGRYEQEHTYSFFTNEKDIPPNADVVHYPFFDPFFMTLPVWKQKPTVVTVHDLIPLVFPQHFPSGLRGAVKWRVQEFSLRSTKRILTDSSASKNDIVRITGYPESRVDVIPLAASGMEFVMAKGEQEAIQKRYALPKRFLLYVGDVNWNKNVMGLLEAWKIFKASDKLDISLVLVGGAFMKPEIPEVNDILSYISQQNLEASVIRTGFVRDEDFAVLYTRAVGLIMPSWYEGFGLPVLEAMHAGVPVIASNRGSIPEISGPALQVDPGDSRTIAETITSLVSMSIQKRSAIIKKGYEWERQYTWQKTAKRTVESYEKALDNNSYI